MRRIILPFVGVTALMVLGGCRSAPVTGRWQLLALPESSEIAMGTSAFQEVLAKEKPSQNPQFVEMVNRVGTRIAAASERPDYQWEFRVLASSEQNAFCLPGGKVAVYEGILPICQTEAGLAVVMSHEVSHALARHGGERISQGYAVEAVKNAVSYVTQTHAEAQYDMIMRGYGVASQYGVLLPYSRKHETEADHIGLILMAKAGYDPQEAPRFWGRFAAANTGAKPIEFASTHPSDQHRIEYLTNLLPQAVTIYQQTPQKIGLGEPIFGGGATEALVQQPASPPPPTLPAPSASSLGPAVNAVAPFGPAPMGAQPAGTSRSDGWVPAGSNHSNSVRSASRP